MTTKLLTVAALAALAVGACSKQDDSKTHSDTKAAKTTEVAVHTEAAAKPAAAEDESPFDGVTVAELARWRDNAEVKVAVFDANGPDTRATVGTIPGAVMLADYSNCKDDLPTDKDQKLVFYCYNEMCGASHAAAKIATAQGFEDVSVLTAGIMGWKNAGQPLTKL